MAEVVDLRGSGLARTHRALAGLVEHPERLALERRRFSNSPPPYKSDTSGTTTRSESPNPPTEEERLRERRRMQLGQERIASEPDRQFRAQVQEERRRIWNSEPRTGWPDMSVHLYAFQDEARETVKKRWVEQGIWNNKWTYFTIGLWKHQEPLELESESETDTEAESSRPLFSLAPKARRPKSDEEKRRIAERRVVREREREASRPYHQFIYQVSKERERIQEESVNGEDADNADINTRAYENVKNIWIKRWIWKTRWVILPGMSWKHEEPLEEDAVDDPIPVSDTAPRNVQPNGNEVANVLFAPLFGPRPPIESSHREPSAVMTTSQQRLPADIDSAGLENGDAGHHPSAPNSPRSRTARQVLPPTKGQVSRPSRRKQSQEVGQSLSATSESLGPVHPSKVSKATRKTKLGRQRRLNISQEVFCGDMPLSSGVDAAGPQSSPPPDCLTPRRSKRIQPPISSVAKDPANTVSIVPSKRAVRSKSERGAGSKLTTRNSAKPQGVLKRQPAKTTRGKARKK